MWCCPVCVPIELLSTYFNLPPPSVLLSSVCPHRAIVNLLQPASVWCCPVCPPIELLSTYFNLPPPSVLLSSVCPHRAIINRLQPASTQCDVVQCVSPQSYCQPTSTCLNPVWCWSSASPHNHPGMSQACTFSRCGEKRENLEKPLGDYDAIHNPHS